MESTSNIQKELEKAYEQKKLRIGMRSVMRALKQGNAVKVFLAANAPQSFKDEIMHYSGLAGVSVTDFAGNSKELGVACKRAHSVLTSVIARA